MEASPSRSTERLAINPSFSLWTPSLPTELWPRFRVSRLCVHGCKNKRRATRILLISIHSFSADARSGRGGIRFSSRVSLFLAKLSRTCSRIDPGQLGECVTSNLGPSDAPAKTQLVYVLVFVSLNSSWNITDHNMLHFAHKSKCLC